MGNGNGESAEARPARSRRPRIQIAKWRPGRKFSAWVRAFSVAGLAESIHVERKTVYQWLKGDCPPHRDSICMIETLSRQFPLGIGPLTLAEIVRSEEE